MEFLFGPRKKLTSEERWAVWSICDALKIDSSIELREGTDFDYFEDYDYDKNISLTEGLKDITDAIAYPLTHDVSEKNAVILGRLFREFVDPEWEDITE